MPIDSFISKQYISMLGASLSRFKWKSSTLAVCRCPMCGDSQKKKTLTRFYFIEGKGGIWRVFCHNCLYSRPFSKFLKEINTPLYDEYRRENFARLYTTNSALETPKKKIKKTSVSHSFESLGIDRVNNLSETHAAIQYLKERQIPQEAFPLIGYTDNFQSIGQKFNSDYTELPKDPRIVIPFYTANNEIFLLCGRSLDPKENLRYITIRSNHPELSTHPKVFGIERLNLTVSPVYVVEGPIDSLFLPNCISFSGIGGDLSELNIPKNQLTIILDNQPRNKDVVRNLTRFAKNGYNVFVWPTYITESKDINEYIVKEKKTREDVVRLIQENTYSGLSASLAISSWKKI